MTDLRIDVVVVTYNSATHVADLAGSVLESSFVSSVHVVDNGSVDGSQNVVRSVEWGAPIEFMQLESNVGFGAAVNRGVNTGAGGAEFILVVNPDVSFEPSALEQLMSDLDADPRLACVGARLITTDGRPVSSAREFPTLRSIARRRQVEVDHGGSLVAADWVCGALMLWRRSAFRQVGGFSPQYFLYFEDVDVCAKAWAAGWAVAVDGAVTAIHDQGHGKRTSAALKRISRSSRRMYARRWMGAPGVAASVLADALEIVGDMLRAMGVKR